MPNVRIEVLYQRRSRRSSGSPWLIVTPWTLRSILNWIKDEYDNPPVLVSENGVSDRNGSLEDTFRVDFIKNYTNFMLQGKFSENPVLVSPGDRTHGGLN